MNILPIHWQPEIPAADPLILQKLLPLLQINSLTQGLQKACAEFSVALLHLGSSHIEADEIPFFAKDAPLWAREVHLQLQGEPVVWARSVCLDGNNAWQEVLDCGTRSLGSLLFGGDMDVTRSAFEYALLPQEHILAQKYQQAIVARRSVFTYKAETLLLQECYLPTLLPFIEI